MHPACIPDGCVQSAQISNSLSEKLKVGYVCYRAIPFLRLGKSVYATVNSDYSGGKSPSRDFRAGAHFYPSLDFHATELT